jgi:small redox-active disulfide protein 2
MNENNNNIDTKKSPLGPDALSGLGVNNNNLENKKPPLGGWGLANMDIKVLGPGCPKCKTLEKATREAVAEAGVDATVSKVDDIVEIMNFGVMRTPALVINNKVIFSGKVPGVKELKEIILKNQ